MLRLTIDSREQRPLDFTGMDVAVSTGSLQTGDYSVVGLENLAAIERKSLDDLIGCLLSGRERFERELARGRGLELFAVVVESSWEDLCKHQYKSRMKPHAAAQSIFAFHVRYGTPFLFMGSRPAAAYAVYSLLQKYVAEKEKNLRAVMAAAG